MVAPILDAQNHQIGVVSFGVECGDARFPGGYARVSAVSQWLENMKCMSSSHVPLDCEEVQIDFNYDDNPTEHGWVLTEDSSQEIIYGVTIGVYLRQILPPRS